MPWLGCGPKAADRSVIGLKSRESKHGETIRAAQNMPGQGKKMKARKKTVYDSVTPTVGS